MAVFQKNLSGDSRYSLKLEVNETNYSTENNTSEVSYVLTATKASGGGYWSNSAINPVNVVLNGEMVVDKKVSYNFSTSTPCTIILANGTKNISHDGDGSKTISVSAYFGDSANSLGNATVSGNLTLTTIPRASEPSCNNVTLGNAVIINTNRKSDAFTHTITVSVDGNVKETFNNVGASVSWTPSISTYAPLSTANSTMSAVITCTTYNNGTQIVSPKTCTTVLYVPDNDETKPTVSISYVEADSTMKSKNWGVFVQGKSKLAITVTGTGKYGTSISNYNATVNGESKSSSSFTTNYLNSSGNQTINATVKDSRGFTSNNVSSTYNVVSYANPTINTAIALRTDAEGNENDDGTYLKYTFIASVSSVSNKNSALYKIGYKKTTDNYYTYVTIADSGYSLSKENQILDGVTLDTSASYDIIFEVIDAFSNTTIDRPITSGFDLMNFNASGKSMAIGKVSEAGANEKKLEIALDTVIERIISNLEMTGQIFMSNYNGILWKEPGFGDKFRIIPYFNGANDSNKLLVQASVGDSGEDPELYDVMSISGKSGNVQIKGDLTVGSFTRNYVDTWMPVLRNGRLEYTERVLPDAVTSSMWPNDQDRLATLRFMSFWNGRYDNDNSNLIYCHQGIIQAFPTTLYENLSGTNGTITLSDNVQYYSCIEIFYCKINDRRKCQSVKVYSPHYTSAALTLSYYTNGFCQLLNTIVDINDNIISFSGNYIGLLNIENNSIVGMSSNSEIVIYKVYGYKH